MPFPAFDDVNPLDGTVDGYGAVRYVDVFPFQGADFTDAQSGAEADVDAEAGEGEVVLDVGQDFPMVGDCQDFRVFASGDAGVFYVPFVMVHPFVLDPELHDHFEDGQHVFDGFDA